MNDNKTKGRSIEITGLGRAFGSFWAVRQVDLSVGRGEIFGLVGPDGAGKTTVMRMAAGVLIPSEGDIVIDGHSVVSDPEKVKIRIGYMSQRFGLYGDLTVLENLRFYEIFMKYRKRKGRQRKRGFSASVTLRHSKTGKPGTCQAG